MLGLATRAIIEALLKSKDFCVSEGDVRRLLKGYGYSEKSVYVYIHRLSKKGIINRRRVGTATQVCLKVGKLRDLGIEIAVLW
jgi:DNA-binding transcriptional regulator PaaX